MWTYFLIDQNRSSNQRSGITLEVQFQNFGERRCTHVENPHYKFFSLCFGFGSAFKTIDAPMFFWSAFLKTHKKKLLTIKKRHFGRFWQLIMGFLCVFKNTDQSRNTKKIFFTVFFSKLKNALFWGSTNFFS